MLVYYPSPAGVKRPVGMETQVTHPSIGIGLDACLVAAGSPIALRTIGGGRVSISAHGRRSHTPKSIYSIWEFRSYSRGPAMSVINCPFPEFRSLVIMLVAAHFAYCKINLDFSSRNHIIH